MHTAFDAIYRVAAGGQSYWDPSTAGCPLWALMGMQGLEDDGHCKPQGGLGGDAAKSPCSYIKPQSMLHMLGGLNCPFKAQLNEQQHLVEATDALLPPNLADSFGKIACPTCHGCTRAHHLHWVGHQDCASTSNTARKDLLHLQSGGS